MKKILLVTVLMAAVALSGCSERYALKQDLKEALKVAVEQEKKQAAHMDGVEGQLPRTFEKGEVKYTGPRGWVSGFFPGSLWLLYEHTGDEELKTLADKSAFSSKFINTCSISTGSMGMLTNSSGICTCTFCSG